MIFNEKTQYMKNLLIYTAVILSVILLSCGKEDIKPTSPEIKSGGLIVYEIDGHGLVVTAKEIGFMNWQDASNTCDTLVLNGYDDWYLPTKDELNQVYSMFKKTGNGILNGCYWSSTKSNNGVGHCIQLFFDGMQMEDPNDGNKYIIRAVRVF